MVKDRLLKQALITSPILSIYGVVPIFLNSKVNFAQFIVGFFLLTILIFSFWILNIILINKTKGTNSRYAASYVSTFLLHAAITMLIPGFYNQNTSINFLIYPLIATLAINTIILVLINSELLKWKKDIAESENQKLKVSNLEAQKQVLLQQLHPHFLFNALSTLKSLIKVNPDHAEDYSVKLSEFLRYSIQAHSNELVTLENELQFTNDYIELQKVRFGKALQFVIEIPDSILQSKLPVFALQTLVENAIKHNLFTEKKPLNIIIKFENSQLKISNNKMPKPLIQKSGTGLKNLLERYKTVSEDAIEIINSDSDFIVYLNLIER